MHGRSPNNHGIGQDRGHTEGIATLSDNSLIPGTFNARHLGGLPAGPQITRPEALIRADAPVGLDASGREAIAQLGIRTAIDLREPIERQQRPPELDGLGVTVIDIPVIGDVARHLQSSLEEIYDVLIGERGEALAAVVTAVAEADPAPVLIFCSAGKDRTGITTALMLAAVGVDTEAIVADYHLTELNMQGAFRERIEGAARESGVSEQEMAVKIGAPEALIRHVLERIDVEFGGAAAFLRRNGVSDATLETLRHRFLG